MKVERGAGCVSGWFKCAGVSTTCASVTLCRLACVSGWGRGGWGRGGDWSPVVWRLCCCSTKPGPQMLQHESF